MASFKAAKYRGKALARLMAGIVLPLPGSGIKLSLFSVPAPYAAPGPVLLANSTTFLPDATGVQALQGNKLFFDFDNPYLGQTAGSASTTTNAVIVDFMNDAGNGIRFVFQGGTSTGGGNGWYCQKLTGGVSDNGNQNFGNAYPNDIRSNVTAAKLGIFYTPTTTNPLLGKIEFRADGALLLAVTNGGSSQLPISTDYTRVRFSNYAGGSRPAITGARCGVVAVPVLTNSPVLNIDYSVTVPISYTNAGGAMDVPNVQLYAVDGVELIGTKRPAILVSNDTPGVAVIKTQDKYTEAQFGTSPKFRVYEVVNGVETGYYTQSSVAMPAVALRPLRIGTNVAQYDIRYNAFTILQDHFIAGQWSTSNGSQPPANWFDAKGFPTDTALEGGTNKLVRRCKQPAEPCTMEISWKHTGATDAVWAKGVQPSTFGNITPQARSGDGRSRATFTISPDLPSTEGMWLVLNSFPAGDPPKDITCYVVGADKSKVWTPTRRAVMSNFAIQRHMDNKYTNGSAIPFGATPRGWASRMPAGAITGSFGTGYDGINMELMCAMVNEIPGNDLWFNLPMYFDNDYYLNVLPLLDSLLLPGRQIYLELGNENRNFTLAGGWTVRAIQSRYAARTGNAILPDNGGAVGQVVEECAYESKRVFELMQPTIPNFSTRCVRVCSSFGGLSEYNTMKSLGFTNYDAATKNAIYVIMPANAGKTLAQMKADFLAYMTIVVDDQMAMRDQVRADGKRFVIYEVGVDWRNVNDTALQQLFMRSDEFKDCMFALYDRLRTDFGDVMIQYYEVSGFIGPNAWGLKEYDTAPTQKGLDGIAAVNALVT